MRLSALLDRCQEYEERAAAVYRSFASTDGDPTLRELWLTLAQEEEEHACSVADALARLTVTSGTWLEGWEEALNDVEQKLQAAEQIGSAGTLTQRFSAALDLELTELEALRHAVLSAAELFQRPAPQPQEVHAERLAETAMRICEDSHVRMQAILLLARSRLGERSAARTRA